MNIPDWIQRSWRGAPHNPGFDRTEAEITNFRQTVREFLSTQDERTIIEEVVDNCDGMWKEDAFQMEIDEEGNPTGNMVPNIPGGSTMHPSPMHTHPDAYIKWSNDRVKRAAEAITGTINIEFANVSSDPSEVINATTLAVNANKLASLWSSANSLKQLHRYLGNNQSDLHEAPDLTRGLNLRRSLTNPTYNDAVFWNGS